MFAAEEDDELFADKFSEATQVQEVGSKRRMLDADASQPPPEDRTESLPVPEVKRLDHPAPALASVPPVSNSDETNPSVIDEPSFRLPPEMVMQADSKESPAAPPPPAPHTGDTDWFEDAEEERTSAEPIPQPSEPFAARQPDASVSGNAVSGNAQNFPGIQMGEGTGPVVLVVDDEPTFRGFLKESLAAEGYRVHTAINAPNALRFLKSDTTVNLVISDLNMPHMDGFELKHEIDVWCGRKLPFIVVSADTSSEKIEIAARVGAAAIVPKPIDDLDAFYAIVKDTLRDAGIV